MKKAFTLVEILLVVAIAAIVFIFSAPYSLKFYRSQMLDDTRSNLVEVLTRARHNAVLMKNDSAWGVKINEAEGHFVLFQGESYDARVDTYDEVYDLLPEISLTGDWTEVVFSKLTGIPNNTGTTTLTYANLTNTVGILIESAGTLSKVVTADVEGDGETCTEFTYSEWSTCSASEQTRTVVTSSPNGCTGGTPDLTQACSLIPTDDLISYWAFDGNMLDSYGNNDGTCTGDTCPTLATGVGGEANTAYSFDGSNDYIDLGITMPSFPVTISVWGNITSADRGVFGNYSYNGHSSLSTGMGFDFDSDQAHINQRNNAGLGGTWTWSYTDDPEWVHGVFVLTSANTYSFYKNGSLVSLTSSSPGSYVASTDNLYIGWGRSPLSSINGVIDNVRLYNRALTPEEITTIYTEEAP